jgi:hypothetical protein
MAGGGDVVLRQNIAITTTTTQWVGEWEQKEEQEGVAATWLEGLLGLVKRV